MMLTERHDLRGGDPPWQDGETDPGQPLPDGPVDVAIIGAGITGALIAERLSADGARVAMIDRRPPGHGSTAASTAQIMWAMDVPLTHLAARIGEDEAAGRWQRVARCVHALSERVEALAIDCGLVHRPTLYLAGDVLDEQALAAEGAMRRAHGLDSHFLSPGEMAARFAMAPRAALLSGGGFELEPVRLTEGLLDHVRRRGGSVSWPHDVTMIEERRDHVCLVTSGGEIRARRLVIAGGYERAPLFLPPAFSLLSTFAIATPPGTAERLREGVMVWEAADPYLYVRATPDGRIIAGGEDESWSSPKRRDAMLPEKAAAISVKLAHLLGCEPLPVAHRWAAMFGSTPDSLPGIGRAANHERVWLAAGFGGNGIAFSALAAELLSHAFAGAHDPALAWFDPYRFGKSADG